MPDKKTVTVIVNGARKDVSKGELTFEEVVGLGFANPFANPNIIYTVAYRRGHGDNPQGTLVQGGDPVKVKDEMIFDVTPTDKS